MAPSGGPWPAAAIGMASAVRTGSRHAPPTTVARSGTFSTRTVRPDAASAIRHGDSSDAALTFTVRRIAMSSAERPIAPRSVRVEPSASRTYTRANGTSGDCAVIVATRALHASSTLRVSPAVSARSCSRLRRRSPITCCVTSLQTQSMPAMAPASSSTALYERLK